MKATIDVRDRAEADRIKTAMSDESTRAVMNVMGALMPLAARERHRVLAFVESGFDDARAGHASGGRLAPGTPDPRD